VQILHNKDMVIDYKRSDILERFVTGPGQDSSPPYHRHLRKHQRALAREIKRARIIALLPFVIK
jgi:small subunit ribosomal protein S18